MANKNIASRLPGHLAPLLQPTPSGAAKLVAAWDGLNTESQILVLTELDTVGLPAYLNENIRLKALDSVNAYVRYLAARGLHFSRDDIDERKALKQRIEDDPDPLVRYCLLEGEHNDLGGILDNPDRFFELPHEARLANIRLVKGGGEKTAALIAHAVDHQLKEGKVSEIELFEILSDYLNKVEFKSHYDRPLSYDGYGEYLAGRDIEALWRLVLKLPEGISRVLIENLPGGAGLRPKISEEILSGMTDGQLATLFYREDIDLGELRKKIFLEADETRDKIKSAAICYNFDLDYAEFAAILAKPEKEKAKILRDLAMMADELNLSLYDAIHDVLFTSDVGLFSWQDAEFARDALERRLKQLKDWRREKQLRELRLYRLAKQAVPWKKGEKGYPPSGELGFLSNLIVEGDTWDTFMAFSKAWAEDSWRTKKLEKHLPRIYGAEEGELGNETQMGDEEAEYPTGLMLRIERKLKEIVSTVTRDDEDQRTEREDRLSKLGKEVNRLVAVQERQSVLLYIVIGLLVWLLIKVF